jgi:cell division septum initiation protein DivIVA
MHAPVHLSIEIEDVEEQIERLGAELRELESIATSASQNVLSANKSERIDWGQETQIGAHPSECRLGKDNFRGPPPGSPMRIKLKVKSSSCGIMMV